MKKKKIYSLCLASLLAASMIPAPVVHAANPEDTFYQDLSRLVNSRDTSKYFGRMELTIGSNQLQLDGVDYELDAPATIRNNRTMLPIRAIAQAAGAEVNWDPDTSTVIITTASGEHIQCPVGSYSMMINGTHCTLDSPAFVDSVSNRTYLPLKAVAEALDLEVFWDGVTSTVSLTAPYQTARVLVWSENHRTLNEPQAQDILYDGDSLYILQYDSPAQAKEAVQRLTARGFQAEADLYLPPAEEVPVSSRAGSTYSWGVETSHFDDFLTQHGNQLTAAGVVAVIDSGIDADHEFLKGRVLPGRDFVDGDEDPDDENDHGTHVSGTILDCVGSAAVKILPVRVLDRDGSGYTSAVVAGVKYAADQGADVMNLSLGGGRFGCDILDEAMNYAVEKGCAAAVAAGNENSSTSGHCPAHMTTPGILTVSAGDRKMAKAYFSNYGDNVDLMAPGVDINAAAPGNTYQSMSGTSMATPHVAAACVLLDMLWKDSLSPSDLETKVQAASTKGIWTDVYQGYGFLDMSKAPVPSSDPAPAPNPDPGQSEIVRYEYDSGDLCLREGDSGKLKVLAVLADGTKVDVTEKANLYSTNPNVASVAQDGTIRALAQGSTMISMSAVPNSIGIPAPLKVEVLPAAPGSVPAPEAEVVAYRYSVNEIDLSVSERACVKVTAIYSDNTTKDITRFAGLYSTDQSVATVSGTGDITAAGQGTAYISMSATPDGIQLPEPVRVTVSANENSPGEDTFVRLFWQIGEADDTGVVVSLAKGRSLKVDLMGETADGSQINLNTLCQPYSSNNNVAAYSNGILTGVNNGNAYLWLKEVPNNGLFLPPILKIEIH